MGRRINSGLASGVRGQVSIENYELISKLVAQAVPGDINWLILNTMIFMII